MYWKKEKIGLNIALLGIENQTTVDRDMPLRVISYDGAAYRSQLDENKGRYPVITLVLYYGKQDWDAPTSLSGLMNVPKELKPYFNDYKINLISVKDMEKDQINKFTSDLKIYFDFC